MEPTEGSTASGEIHFHYVKSSTFRVVHADGVWGGVAPRGGAVNLAFWSERHPIPQKVVHELDSGGKLGREIRSKREVRDGLIREVDFEVVLSIDNAKELRSWLEGIIAEAEKLERGSEE